MAAYDIRVVGDPILRQQTREITEIDSSVARLVDEMLETMYEAPGIGLAAPQVGVQKRLFVWDIGHGPQAIINPQIIETAGEWHYEEACLSVPGLSWDIVRPKTVHLVGLDLGGNEVAYEGDELEGRLFQHEVDHLDGTLLIERLDPEQRKLALKAVREQDYPSRASGSPGDNSRPRNGDSPQQMRGELRLP